jgi:hypothetical protein
MPSVDAILHHGMRAYYLPLVAGVVLAASAFLPQLYLADVAFGGVSTSPGRWTLALGLAAVLLASLSLATRKNSRHPLLLVGIMAIGLQFLGWQWTARAVTEQAWATSQASAIVTGNEPVDLGPTTRGPGVYVGLAAASVIALFGMTIVVRQVVTPYADPDDDD